MSRLRLAFRAFDPHELLVHFIAEREGIYRHLEVEVELVDLRGGESPHDATVACGAALFAALEGASIRIQLVASRAPMFWLYRARSAANADPASGRIATYPPGAPPGRFLELVVGAGATFVGSRDDQARLALIRSDQTDFALLSSATPPSRVDDLEAVFCLADRVPVPTTGVAADPQLAPRLGPLLEAHRRSLEILAAHPARAVAACREAFGFAVAEAEWAVAAAHRYFTTDGRVCARYIGSALSTVGATSSPYESSAVAAEQQPIR